MAVCCGLSITRVATGDADSLPARRSCHNQETIRAMALSPLVGGQELAVGVQGLGHSTFEYHSGHPHGPRGPSRDRHAARQRRRVRFVGPRGPGEQPGRQEGAADGAESMLRLDSLLEWARAGLETHLRRSRSRGGRREARSGAQRGSRGPRGAVVDAGLQGPPEVRSEWRPGQEILLVAVVDVGTVRMPAGRIDFDAEAPRPCAWWAAEGAESFSPRER